jgi:hypothetical protein
MFMGIKERAVYRLIERAKTNIQKLNIGCAVNGELTAYVNHG